MAHYPSPLTFRVKEEEKQLLQEAANKTNMTRSSFIRFAIHKYMDQLIAKGDLPPSFVFSSKSD
jgi:uncharacterized protein (DUF1778 family)